MAVISKITKLTEERFINLFKFSGDNDKGHHTDYIVASRAKDIEHLKATTQKNNADSVAIYSLYGEKKDKVVLVKQYRYPVNTWVYELPAGLVDAGETFREAAVREMHEETGLKFTPIDTDPSFEMPRYTTVGMSDEACATVYGYAEGEISDKYLEASEEIEIVLADRDEVRRILREERVALLLAYQMMHFLHDEEPFAFLK